MFVDASAIVAIIAKEADWRSLSGRVGRAERVFVSPLTIWEAVSALSREATAPVEAAQALVADFIRQTGATVIQVDEATGRLAIEAFARFGKGRHPARLNFGDCFAYACARRLGMPLLYKGNDFGLTDIETA